MTVRIVNNEAIVGLSSLDPQSVNCVVTSPPYWMLRDYGAEGQLGMEETPDEFVARLVDIMRHVRRVLRDDGVLWMNLGDTYASDDKWGGSTSGKHVSALHGKTGVGRTKRKSGLKSKDLVGIPWRVALALQADGWYLRSEVIWHKPSPMPEAVKDRPTRAHEHIFLLTKSRRYQYDAEAIKEPVTGGAHTRGSGVNPKASGDGADQKWKVKQNASFSSAVSGLVETRNKRTVWTVAQEPFRGAHFATFPTKLIEPCILAGCPPGGTVLDPFGGAGTTGLVADRLGRDAVLIDINPEYCRMARERIDGDAPLLNREVCGD